jgi:hypothetical protein
MAEEAPQIPTEQSEQAQSQPEQATTTEQDPLVQGMRVFFQRLQSQQQEKEAACEQGFGR